MTDIDFDELDRAVNSTFESGDTKTDKPESITVRTSTPNLSQDKPTSPAMRRSSGRFMDVVHPSSDMKNIQPAFDSRPSIAPSSKSEDVVEDSGDEEKLDDLVTEQSSDNAVKPLESPFLTDAKVEKRPLGAFSSEPQKPVNSEGDNSDSDEVDHPIEKDVPMPAELHEDLLSIEGSDGDVVQPEVAPIVQQYVEKPVVPSNPTVPMYSSEAYNQPLAHPKKDKSGWLMVLWIFVLIILGAGAGAAVYFYVLPII